VSVTAETYGRAVVFNIKGDLTEDILASLTEAVDHHLESDSVIDVILNMEESPFLDSAALEHLLDVQDRLVERLGAVKLVNCDENVRKIIEMTRLDMDFETYDDIATAVKVSQT